MLRLLPRVLKPTNISSRVIKDFRGFAPAASASFPDVVRDALATNDMLDEADSVLKKLAASKVKDANVASKLTNDDWREMGVNVGERIVIVEALESHLSAKPKLARMGSRGGSIDKHQRSL